MLEPVRPEAVLPDRELYLPTFSHFLIVNKTSLSAAVSRKRRCTYRPSVIYLIVDKLLSLSLSLSLSFVFITTGPQPHYLSVIC